MYYECHITMMGDPGTLKPMVEDIGWKFSAIDGDPVMGDGVKCYATTFFNARVGTGEALERLLIAAAALRDKGAEVVRRKIELVVFDDRTTKCQGGCPECVGE
jgi:hypothetical protein